MLSVEKQKEEQTPTKEFSVIAQSRRGMKTQITAVLATVGSVALIVCGIGWWQQASSHEETDDAYVDGDMTMVSSRVPGTVNELDVTDNQMVKAGDLILKLDPRDYQNAVQMAQADYDLAVRQLNEAKSTVSQVATSANAQSLQAKGEVGNASAGVDSAKASISEMQAMIQQAQSQLVEKSANRQEAQLDYNRYAALDKEGAVTGQQFDQARTNLAIAQAQETASSTVLSQAQQKLLSAQASYKQSLANVTKSQGSQEAAYAAEKQTNVNIEHVKVAQAQVEKAKAALDKANLDLSYTNVIAPVSGQVGKRSIEVGQRVDAGQSMLFIIQPKPWVTANFKETQLGHMKPGQPVEVTVDTFGGHKFQGHVDSLAPASGAKFAVLPPDNATGNFTKVVQRMSAKIDLDTTAAELKQYPISQGMSCEVSVKVR